MQVLWKLAIGFILLTASARSADTNRNIFYSPNGSWSKVANTNCLVWNSYPRTNETVTWSGGIEDGKSAGKGVLQWFTNGAPTTLYVGTLKGGLADGHGITKASDGFAWEGDWQKGSLVSKEITITEPNGTKYVGEHRAGVKDGSGTLTFKNGNTYKGQFKNGTQEGVGEEILGGGQKYVGEYRAGRFHGKGTLFSGDGGKIVGNWKGSQLEGIGEYHSPSGQKAAVRMIDGSLQMAK
jgi:hypothetical protein